VTKYNLDIKKKELENSEFKLSVVETEGHQMKKELDDINNKHRTSQK